MTAPPPPPASQNGTPWVEKHRPRVIQDVIQQEEVVKTLERSMESANLPHLLFYGPPGTGKTSTALAVARQLYGPVLMKDRVLELNASDERGIAVVRGKIKDFASIAIGQGAAGYPSPPYKILVLDEADSMTEDAQNALRRTMETYSKVTRFIIICNYVSKIIEPIASRCAKFRFKPIDDTVSRTFLQTICAREGLTCDEDALSQVAYVAQGDMRAAITTLQSAARLYGSTISAAQVLAVSQTVPEEDVQSMLDAMLAKKTNFEALQKAVQGIVDQGYSALQVLLQVSSRVASCAALPDLPKAHLAIKAAEVEKCLLDGADEFLQLLDYAGCGQRLAATAALD